MSQDRPFESWWTPDQLRLVEDRDRTWRSGHFEPSDMVLFGRDGERRSIGRQLLPEEAAPVNGEVVKAGWDHAHCELCWAKISAEGDDQRTGYTDINEWFARHASRHMSLRASILESGT